MPPTPSPRLSPPGCCPPNTPSCGPPSSTWRLFFSSGTRWPRRWATGIIHTDVIDNYLILSALIGAIVWNLHHLVAGASQQFLARPDRRADRRGPGEGRARRSSSGQGSSRRRLFIVISPTVGMILGLVMMILVLNLSNNQECPKGRHDLPAASALLGGRLQPEPRDERRPEDHGHHHDGPLQLAATSAAPSTSPGGSSSCATSSSPWGPCPAAGGSSRPWARRSPSCRPWAGFCAETAAAISIIGATIGGHPREHDPHDHGRHCRRGCDKEIDGGPLGDRREHRLGLDPHHSHVRTDCGLFLLSLPVLHVMPQESASHRAASTGAVSKTPVNRKGALPCSKKSSGWATRPSGSTRSRSSTSIPGS